MSLLRNIFNGTARPVLLHFFGDDSVAVSYQEGDVCRAGLAGVIRNITKDALIDEHGDRIKVTRCELVLKYDLASTRGGIANPQFRGVFKLKRPHEAEATTWAVDDEPGRGISVLDESFVVVHLVQMDAMTRSHQDFYMR